MISVIIPTLNEEGHIADCIENIQAEDAVSEIIISDGGSTDRTIELAGKFEKVKIANSSCGRGTQLNSGAISAKGDILLFLHADTKLQAGWAIDISRSLEDKTVSGGAFTFRIDNPQWKYRLVEQWVRFRCSIFRLPYGDQGIFIRRGVFESLGGYKDIPLMEDVNFVERMKKTGRVVMLKTCASVSERRWARNGLIYTALMNQMIMALYRLGISPHRLARLYYR